MNLKGFYTRKEKKKRIKYKLDITQTKNIVQISGEFSDPDYRIKELWLLSRKEKNWEKISTCPDFEHSSFSFSFDLSVIYPQIHIDDKDIFDFYVKVSIEKNKLQPATLEKLAEKAKFVEYNGIEFAEYFLRLGRFQHTTHNSLVKYGIPNEEKYMTLYITNKGNLSLYVAEKEPKNLVKVRIDKVRSKRNLLKIEGLFISNHSYLKAGNLLIKGRQTNREIYVPFHYETLERETENHYGLIYYRYKIVLLLNNVDGGELLQEDVYDLFISASFTDGHEETIRLGRPRFAAKQFTTETEAVKGNKVTVINPYYTFKQSNLSLEITEFDKNNYNYLKKLLRWAWLLRLFYKHKDIWLVGERTYKAQDTGYHFFKYIREQHPEKNTFYVIDKSSPEFRNVEKLGNVLDFKSREHIWHTIMSTAVVSSHHPDYLYPLRTKKFKKKIKAKKIFLQHGIMGTKNMIANYGKRATSNFQTDAFLVSSDFEKNMIVNDFGYDPRDVFVTGLSRFDELFHENTPLKNQLLIIPTWRDWIGSNQDFLETEYFRRYHALIHDEKLHQLAKKYQFEIVFCLHPNMQIYTPYFKNAPVRVISQGEVDVQRLLKESAVMITDYSSVGFDFSFLEKPIIYYQFDRGRFIGKRPSHLELDQDLPGDIVFEHEDVLRALEDRAIHGFRMKEEYKKRSQKFLKYRDRNSCERIYKVVSEYKPRRSRTEEVLNSEFFRAVCKKYRKSKYYFPTMKIFYNIARRILPVDHHLILFESSVGKHYADSPRNIYEELLNRADLRYKKVWACNDRKIRFSDKQTKKIKRLSPQYYYYLARAKYWVNNQNFPTYIKKRKQTIYLQTWHGTPLKKMLYDIEEIHGRDESYLERVSNAVKNWDYLLSPSSYATAKFRSAFHYDGEILEFGYPRNDLFFNKNKEQVRKKVMSKLNLPRGKKVILYAPTFRDDQKSSNHFSFDLNMDIEKLFQELGNEYVLLLRMHVVVKSKIKIPEEYQDFMINVSNYPDIQELYLISDILITDYSSVMFDFAITKRPILYYAYDLEEYRDHLRGFYIDFEKEAPGPFLRNTDDIVYAIHHLDKIRQEYQDKYNQFYQKYCGGEDGSATKRVVDYIFDKKNTATRYITDENNVTKVK